MKKGNGNYKLVGGLLAGVIIGGATVVGANQAIQAIQNTEIKVSLNGKVQEFKDETTGETQYPITYHDRTYLPLRNVAQLSGLSVDYNSSTNTAVLDSINDLNNTISHDEMVERLKLTVYSNNEVTQKDPNRGTPIDNLIFDIDNNSVPEIIYIGNSILQQPEDCFQVFTLKEDKVVSTIHEHSLIYVPTNVFQTNNGVYVYELTGDGPETYRSLSKLELNGLELKKKEVLYEMEISPDSGINRTSIYRVDGKEATKELFDKKVEELKKYKTTKKMNDSSFFNDLWK